MEREVALVRVDVYSAHDAFIGTIPTEELLGFSHSDTLNGEDSVSVTTLFHLKAGYRLVWKDEDGIAHEHICQDPKGYHNNGVTLYTDTALNSICETFYDYIEDKRPYSYTFAQALAVALEPTRWSVGTVDQSGTVSSGLTFYHTSAREALQAILECGGELETVITVSGQGVTKRAVNILAHRGESSTHKRFSYGKDITSVSKTEHWGAITACYGYGKGVETDSGGYGRKLTFGDINNNKNYVEDADALKTYGRPNGSGFAHKFGTYENSDCEDASQLLAETKAYLEEHKVPGVTYEADVVDLVQFDRKWEGYGVGDDVQLVDTEFEPELRLTGRVSKLVVDYIGATRSVTLGNVTETMASIYQQQQAELANISRRSSNWDATTSASPSWLNTLMGNLNEQFNTSGNSYCFTSFEQGTIWSSVPLDENGKPTKTGGTAIQLCSQGLRIASGTKADGTFDWRSFGTGKGFTADEINAGTMTADRVRAGLLTDEAGKNYWNMDTGEFSLSGSGDNGASITISDDSGELIHIGGDVTTGMRIRSPFDASTVPLSWAAYMLPLVYNSQDQRLQYSYSFGSTTPSVGKLKRDTVEETVYEGYIVSSSSGNLIMYVQYQTNDYLVADLVHSGSPKVLGGQSVEIITSYGIRFYYRRHGSTNWTVVNSIGNAAPQTSGVIGLYYTATDDAHGTYTTRKSAIKSTASSGTLIDFVLPMGALPASTPLDIKITMRRSIAQTIAKGGYSYSTNPVLTSASAYYYGYCGDFRMWMMSAD